jgi:hypothetical protein
VYSFVITLCKSVSFRNHPDKCFTHEIIQYTVMWNIKLAWNSNKIFKTAKWFSYCFPLYIRFHNSHCLLYWRWLSPAFEDGDSMFHPTIASFLPNYMASHPKRHHYSQCHGNFKVHSFHCLSKCRFIQSKLPCIIRNQWQELTIIPSMYFHSSQFAVLDAELAPF